MWIVEWEWLTNDILGGFLIGVALLFGAKQMRYFKLINNAAPTPMELDITTTENLFHDISGLGFEEDTDFRSVGDVWWLNSVSYSQSPVSGRMMFTDLGGTTPYRKYQSFYKFISRAPLTLLYYPHGLETEPYRRRVRVTKLEKTELNEYGVLDCDIEFMPYTPWYQTISEEIKNTSTQSESGWIWGGTESDPLVFEPAEGSTNKTPAKFRGESQQHVDLDVSISNKSPAKLCIYGPITDPSWTHYVGNELVGTGGFSFDNHVVVNEDEVLVIDSTDGAYSITINAVMDELPGRELRNVYALRNFNTSCFLFLQEGKNRIAVSSSGGAVNKIRVEGHIYYATV